MYDQYGRPMIFNGRRIAYDQNGRAYYVDQGAYGSPGMPGSDGASSPGAPQPVAPQSPGGAILSIPTLSDMNAANPNKVKNVRAPFYPTAPYYSTDQNVGHRVRYYSKSLSPSDTGYAVNSSTPVKQAFDIPGYLVALNASAFNEAAGNAFPVGVNPLDTFKINIEWSGSRQKLVTEDALGSTVFGRLGLVGELGGTGWAVDAGGTIVFNITPLIANTFINVVMVISEVIPPTNYSQ
jgi:hypothetical protein